MRPLMSTAIWLQLSSLAFTQPPIGKPAGQLVINSLNGGGTDVTKVGRVAVITFLFLNPPNAPSVVSTLNPISRDYSPKGVEFIASSVNSLPLLQQFVQQHPPDFLLGWSSQSDTMGFLRVSQLMLPYVVVLDPQGNVRADLPWQANIDKKIRHELDTLLAGSTTKKKRAGSKKHG